MEEKYLHEHVDITILGINIIKEKDIMNNTETAFESKMLFYLERTGGIAGLRMTVMLNTESLPLEDARKLYEMVEDDDFFSLPFTASTLAFQERR